MFGGGLLSATVSALIALGGWETAEIVDPGERNEWRSKSTRERTLAAAGDGSVVLLL